MLPSTSKSTFAYPIDNILKQERNYAASIQKQIEQEELNYKAAMKADKTFEEVKAIRRRINQLKKLIR